MLKKITIGVLIAFLPVLSLASVYCPSTNNDTTINYYDWDGIHIPEGWTIPDPKGLKKGRYFLFGASKEGDYYITCTYGKSLSPNGPIEAILTFGRLGVEPERDKGKWFNSGTDQDTCGGFAGTGSVVVGDCPMKEMQ